MYRIALFAALFGCFLTSCSDNQDHAATELAATVPTDGTEGFKPNRQLRFRYPADFESNRFQPGEMTSKIRATICHPGGAIAIRDECAEESVAISLELAPLNIVERYVGSAAGFPGPYANFQFVGASEFGLEERINEIIDGTDWLAERIYVGSFHEEPMFIYCKDSGNEFPNVCIMYLENVLDPPDDANFSLLTKATFPEKMLVAWPQIAASLSEQISDRGSYLAK